MKNRISIVLCILICIAGKGYSQYKFTTKSNKAIKYIQNAMSAFDVHNNEGAKQELLKSLDADPNFMEAHMLLGDVYDDMKAYQLSAEEYKKAVAINPDFFPNNFFSSEEKNSVPLKSSIFAVLI